MEPITGIGKRLVRGCAHLPPLVTGGHWAAVGRAFGARGRALSPWAQASSWPAAPCTAAAAGGTHSLGPAPGAICALTPAGACAVAVRQEHGAVWLALRLWWGAGGHARAGGHVCNATWSAGTAARQLSERSANAALSSGCSGPKLG